MNIAARTLLRAGAEASMVEDFRALAEATAPGGGPRYRERPLLEDLARFLVRGAGGPNRDAAFYELCHLVNAVDAAGTNGDRRNSFFLDPEAATPGRFQARLDSALARGGWRRAGFTRIPDGLAIRYPDGDFTIRFARMPFLAALYEFLAGMDDFSFYEDLETIFGEMTGHPPNVKAVQAASNRIASYFRQYRRRHLAHARQEGKFDLLLGFVAERSPSGTLVIDDAAVLEFWAQKSSAGDFRVYRTVFDAFATFMRALNEAAQSEAVTRASSIGVDREKGEIEPDDSNIGLVSGDDWESPLGLLDEEPAASIKFFKKEESERKPIEALMHYGPTATRLPLAFLRLESFGAVQSAITTDLQVGRGRERLESRTACTDAQSYGEIVTRFENILVIVRRLQKAAFYALHSEGRSKTQADGGNVIDFSPAGRSLFDQARAVTEEERELPDKAALQNVIADSAKTFRALARRGFDEQGLADEMRLRGFKIGAGALVAVGAQLEAYLAAAGRIACSGQALERWFDVDRCTFSEQFRVLYGVKQ